MAATIPVAAEITMVFWAAEIAVSGLSFYFSAAEATDAVTVSSAADAVMVVATITIVVTGLSGLSFFPASVAATIPAANQYFRLISGRLLREPIFRVIL